MGELQALEPLRVERRKKKNKKKKKKKTRKREARRSTERRRFGDDVSLFVRACDDDDDDDDDTPTTVLSIWRTTTHLLVLFCPRRVEIEREQKKRHEHPRGADDDDDESCRGRRHRHRRRRVLRKGSVVAETPVLIDFWATWCGPCKLISKVVEKAAPEYKGNLKIVKIETDPNPILVEKYEVYGLPTLMVFKDGEPVKGSKREGAINLAKLKDYLQTHGVSPA